MAEAIRHRGAAIRHRGAAIPSPRRRPCVWFDGQVLYLEDLPVGERLELGSVVADEQEMLAFARRFDPQTFHVDPVAARETSFGGLIASGWHTGAMFARLYVDGLMGRVANLGGMGFDEVRFVAPVRPGDRLHAVAEVLEARPSERKPDRGTLTTRGTLTNDAGELAFSMRTRTRVARRPDGDPPR